MWLCELIREPAVAGMFYPADKNQLIAAIEKCFQDKAVGPGALPERSSPPPRKGNIVGLISPHAGYIYSGPVAAHGFLEQFKDGKPEFFVIIGPNHTGLGPGISVHPPGKWRTPLGDATLPDDIIEKIIKQPYFRSDTSAHSREHSIEVQVPFLQYLYGEDVAIVPIALKDQSKETVDRIANVLGKILTDYDFCLIASSDLTHFESQAAAMAKDSYVIENIKKLKPNNLLEVVNEKYISMCGPAPVASVIKLSKKFGVSHAKVLKYATSGDVTGNKAEVVAYLSAILTKEE